jgi:hypothetical protein
MGLLSNSGVTSTGKKASASGNLSSAATIEADSTNQTAKSLAIIACKATRRQFKYASKVVASHQKRYEAFAVWLTSG